MKKLILSTTFLIAGTFSILAQGLVDFSNAPWEAWPDGGTVDRYVYTDTIGGTRVSDPTWTAALFEGDTKLGDSVQFFGGGGFEGIFAADGVQRVISVPQLGVTSLEVRIYNASGTLLGTSAPFQYTHAASVPPAGGDTVMVNFRAFAVPEPSTIALGVLGLGALLLFRRRK